jgi:hypothetical protein
MPRVRGCRGLATKQVRALLVAAGAILSDEAAEQLAYRIRCHRRWYALGKARQDLSPQPGLILTGRALPPGYPRRRA